MNIDTTVYIDTEGRPFVKYVRNPTEENIGGIMERCTSEQAGFLFALGYKKARKTYYGEGWSYRRETTPPQ
jgi:hypothetical protein